MHAAPARRDVRRWPDVPCPVVSVTVHDTATGGGDDRGGVRAAGDPTSTRVRTALRAILLTGVTYATGWGFVLPVVHLFAVVDDIDRDHPEMVDVTLLWAAGTTVAAQVAIAVGIAPLGIDDVITAHVLAAGGLALVVLIARRLLLSARAQKQSLRRVERREARFRALVEDAADMVLVLDDDLSVRWCSPSTTRLLGTDVGRDTSYISLVHEDDRERVRGLVAAARESGERPRPELFRLPSRKGLLVVEARHRDLRANPAVRGHVASLRDVTQRERQRAEAERSRARDTVTGLLQLQAFSEALDAALVSEHVVGLVEVHVVGLRAMVIADGRESADGMLREVARQLETVRRPQDDLARTADDTFALLLRDVDDDALTRLPRVAYRRTSKACSAHDTSLRIAVGAATSNDGADAHTLQQCVRIAAEHAIASPSAPRIERFYAGMRLELEHHIAIERSLPAAIEQGQFHLAYQPIFAAEDPERIVGVEALLRWRHPKFGALPPSRFIPMAERTGLIVDLGHWALVEATRQLVAWDEQTGPGVVKYVGVNLSARQLANGDVLSRVRDALERSGLEPRRLLVELTESALVEDAESAAVQLRQLSDLGIRLALDDFGTGWASMASLQHYPFDVLKIDRSFVSHGAPQRRPEMLASMVALGRNLELQIIAEGVEHPAELEEVRALGADFVQGWLLGRPQPPEELAAFASSGIRR